MNPLGAGVAMFLLTLTAVPTPRASASPPDPAWGNGVSDVADYDDVVIGPRSATAIVVAYRVDQPPTPIILAMPSEATRPAASHHRPFQNAPRSPPAPAR